MLENVNGCSDYYSRLKIKKEGINMPKIEIENAYDDFTQFTLFDDELKSSIEEADNYETQPRGYVMNLTSGLPGKHFNLEFGTKSFTDFAQAVRKLYVDAWEKTNLYTTIRYNEMLRDDIMNGYVIPLKTKDDYYVIYLTPEADGNANILAHRKLFKPEVEF